MRDHNNGTGNPMNEVEMFETLSKGLQDAIDEALLGAENTNEDFFVESLLKTKAEIDQNLQKTFSHIELTSKLLVQADKPAEASVLKKQLQVLMIIAKNSIREYIDLSKELERIGKKVNLKDYNEGLLELAQPNLKTTTSEIFEFVDENNKLIGKQQELRLKELELKEQEQAIHMAELKRLSQTYNSWNEIYLHFGTAKFLFLISGLSGLMVIGIALLAFVIYNSFGAAFYGIPGRLSLTLLALISIGLACLLSNKILRKTHKQIATEEEMKAQLHTTNKSYFDQVEKDFNQLLKEK
jgi:hypothetical protein